MSYLVLARKYRPQRFDEVIGQDHVVSTLQNAVRKDRIAHAFLFTGARGVGKTTAARLLAKALQCEHGPTPEPCGECQACTDVAEGRAVDVLEIDGASNRGIDQVRELREGVRYMPQAARFKMIIIDEVHMLTVEAFNALLKTLEEPPAHVKFIFATTDVHKIPVTILSRCQRYDFKLIGPGQIADQLKKLAAAEDIKIDDEAAHQIARAAQGSMRDGQSLLDQVIAYTDKKITSKIATEALGIIDRKLLVELSDAILAQDASTALGCVASAYEAGFDLRQLLGDLVEELRHLVVARAVKKPAELIDLPAKELEGVVERSASADPNDLQRLFNLALDHVDAVARADSPRMVLDVLVARMASIPPYRSLAELSSLVEQLRGGGLPPPPAGGRGPSRSSGAARARSTGSATMPRARTESGASSAAEAPATVARGEQPAAAPQQAAPGIDPRWIAVVAAVRAEDPALSSFLEHALVNEAAAGEELTLRFAQAFYADAVRDKKKFKTVTDAVRVHYPAAQKVRVETGERAGGEEQVSIAEANAQQREDRVAMRESEAREGKTVQLAVEIFGGTVLKVKEA